MSECLELQYRPTADALMDAHGLVVPEMTRDMVARLIMENRELDADPARERDSVFALARKALRNVNSLIRYAGTPPSRPESITSLYIKLAANLDERVALEVGLKAHENGVVFEWPEILNGIAAQNVPSESLEMLAEALQGIIKERVGVVGGGRPWGELKPIVRAAGIAWIRAGHSALGYAWDDCSGTLSGPFPAFLKDLIDCCAGKSNLLPHRPSRRVERDGKNVVLRSKGDRLAPSDSAIHQAVIGCMSLPTEMHGFQP